MQIEIAFAGRSNVGKSSLLNKLMNRKNLARTSSTPGCTRQINFFSVRTAQGINLSLVDLPGYGYAKRSKDERKLWAELIDGYLDSRVPQRVRTMAIPRFRKASRTVSASLMLTLSIGSNLFSSAIVMLPWRLPISNSRKNGKL